MPRPITRSMLPANADDMCWGGVARSEIISVDVWRSSGHRRLALQSDKTRCQGVEPAHPRSASGWWRIVSLHSQHQPNSQQTHHALRQRWLF